MYFYVEKAKGRRICEVKRNREFPKSNKRTIRKGQKCLVFSNGTIGQGARSKNYSKKEAIKMLKKLIQELEG